MSEEGRIRFHLAVQNSRLAFYTFALALAFVNRFLGVFSFELAEALIFWAVISLSALGFRALYRHRIDVRYGIPLEPIWMACDVFFLSYAVARSGGLDSMFYVFYVTNAGAAAFVGGISAAIAVIIGDTVAYLVALRWVGDLATFDDAAIAVARMIFLFGAAFFFLRGVAKLKERQTLIRELRREDNRRLAELSRLTRELDRANEKLRGLALTDPLTGLHNRRYFEERIDQDWATVRRDYVAKTQREGRFEGNTDLGIALADIDHFKRVNDRYGHAVGDRVLQTLAEILTETVRGNDSVIRWGGEEFLVVMRRVDRHYVGEVVDRLRARIEDHPFDDGGATPIELTCSVGWSCYPAGEDWIDLLRWQQVMHLADQGLYLAKENGRDLAVGVVPGPRAPTPEEMERMLADLAWAVDRTHLDLVCERALELDVGQATSSRA